MHAKSKFLIGPMRGPSMTPEHTISGLCAKALTAEGDKLNEILAARRALVYWPI